MVFANVMIIWMFTKDQSTVIETDRNAGGGHIQKLICQTTHVSLYINGMKKDAHTFLYTIMLVEHAYNLSVPDGERRISLKPVALTK